MNSFVTCGMVVGLLVMIFYTPGCMAMSIDAMNGDRGFGKEILCFTPIINIIRCEVKYFGKLGIASIGHILFILSIVAKAVTYLYMYDQLALNLGTNILLIVSTVFLYVSNMVLVYTIIKDADVMTKGSAFFISLLYPLGQWYIYSSLLSQIREKQNMEATFRG